MDLEPIDPLAREEREGGRTEPRSRFEEGRAGGEDLAPPSDRMSRLGPRLREDDPIAAGLGPFDRDDAVGADGHGRAGHDAQGGPRGERGAGRISGGDDAQDRQLGPGFEVAREREAVERRDVGLRQVRGGGEAPREDRVERLSARARDRRQRAEPGLEATPRLFGREHRAVVSQTPAARGITVPRSRLG